MSWDTPPTVVAPSETPAYVYDVSRIRSARAALSRSLPSPHSLFYSVKANPHPDIVRALVDLGCGVEVSSDGELEAVSATGVDRSRVMLTGPGKSERLVSDALRLGYSRLSIESVSELRLARRLAKTSEHEVRCLIRINPDVALRGAGLSFAGRPSQFGIDAVRAMEDGWLFERSDNLKVDGVHFYLGTNVRDGGALRESFHIAIAAAAELSQGRQFDVLALGGGFGAPFGEVGEHVDLEGLESSLAEQLDAAFPEWRAGHPRIWFEAGRFLVSSCGTLFCRVLDLKVSKGETFLVLESGINHLGGMSGLGRLRPTSLFRETSDGTRGATVVGPLCTTLDLLGRRSVDDLNVGAVVAIPNVGAYGLTGSLLAFLSHPAPAEIVIDGSVEVSRSRLHIVRRSIT